jgi:hypothetical protein
MKAGQKHTCSTSNSCHAKLTLADCDQMSLAIEQIDALCVMALEHAEHDPRLLTALALIAERCEKQKAILDAAEARHG